MTGVQSRLLELMDEIKSICLSENLSYVLCFETAAYFSDFEKFGDERFDLKILMPYDDIKKLEKYVENNFSDTRFIESWRNNEKLQLMKFRYVDKTTLLYDGGATEHHIAPGICVSIYPARGFQIPRNALACERYLQLANKGQSKRAGKIVFAKFLEKLTRNENFRIRATKRLKIDSTYDIHKSWLKHFTMSDKKMAKFIMAEQDKAVKPGKPASYFLTNDRSRLIELPDDLFVNTSTVTFEGKEFNVYADREVFLSAIYPEDWRERSKLEAPGTDRITVIYDENMPYQQYLDFIADDEVSLEQITKDRLKYNLWMNECCEGPVERAKFMFNRARRSVDRIDMWYDLRPKRDELRKAYDENNIEKLKSILSNYLKTTDRYYEMGIGFFIDKEIFKYAKLIWAQEGRTKEFLDQLRAMIPKLYKRETPDEYFAKRGTKIIDKQEMQ